MLGAERSRGDRGDRGDRGERCGWLGHADVIVVRGKSRGEGGFARVDGFAREGVTG